jgi:hypothetical protein
MSSTDFEALGLRFNDRIWIQDGSGFASWGKYLEDYDHDAQTFLFQPDRGDHMRAVIHLPSVVTIER